MNRRRKPNGHFIKRTHEASADKERRQNAQGFLLREGYAGFCPLEVRSGGISGGGGHVEKKHWKELDPQLFFDCYVKARKPLVISTNGASGGALGVLFGLHGEAANWAMPGSQGMQAMRNSAAAHCEVVVERRSTKSSLFGQSDDTSRQKTTFGTFCQELENGNELGYLTTQALEDEDGCPKSLAAEHVLKLLRGCQSLRPELVGKLTPVQYNMWFGRSSVGSSSGLHHDFHDNIYVLLRGRKEFRLFSPRCLDILTPAGIRKAQLHPNGLISYVPGLRDDGAPSAAVLEWQSQQAQGNCEKNRQTTQATNTNNSSEDEHELEQMLNDAMSTQSPEASDSDAEGNGSLPDSFCQVSTTSSSSPIPKPLKGRHITADLGVGDLLYLPASWFHEVISFGGDSGGHLALNLWMAPPHSGSTWQAPYEDGFWESFFCRLNPSQELEAPEVRATMLLKAGQGSAGPAQPIKKTHPKLQRKPKRLPFSHRARCHKRDQKSEHVESCTAAKGGRECLTGLLFGHDLILQASSLKFLPAKTFPKLRGLWPSTAAMGQNTSTAVLEAVSAMTGGAPQKDPLDAAGSCIFDDKVMAEKLPAAVLKRFQECLISGAPTPEEDQKIIADIMYAWARERGAIDFAHWFFPLRGGGGAVGGMLGAFKQDTLLDLDFSSKYVTKPMKACLPAERLFQGETDGSSFPNGGLRVTHSAAAFTTWDRTSPPFVLNKTLYIPCAFVTHFGKCIDEKTPLLRSMDAVKVQGLRMLKAVGLGKDVKTMHSYLGWEQEFFVIDAAHYKARPDLVNTGRTLFGKLPTRHQQGDLNYFQPIPTSVATLLDRVQALMLEVGCPMAVKHNEVAPGQHEMSPVFRAANVSCDSNVLFMEVMNREAAKLGLQVLFHEKPFAGINGSGKHANWSVGTDTGLNFFYPGKTEEGAKLFVTGIACLAYGLAQYNELVRCTVATAGNDHRLGAQEAPPAIISLYPGQGFEQYVDSIIAGGDLLGYKAEKKKQPTGCSQAMFIEANIEDRNRTAPFPFCGNRFEFRAVGSSQNCCLPVMVCNAIMAEGMGKLAEMIEGGMSHRDAVAKMFQENKHVIFTGNGYSDEWKQEAAKRGLPNLNTTPKALATWNSDKNSKLFETLKIYTPEETAARQEVMYENYIGCLSTEAETMVNMTETGILPACAKDLQTCGAADSKFAAPRKAAYEAIVDELEKLKKCLESTPHGGLEKEAEYFCDTVKPLMVSLRKAVDAAESVMDAGLYPYPTYEQMIYSHHF